jgi:ribosome-associated protein
MADHIAAFVHKAGMKTPRIEGKTEANWIVVDAGDVIVHLFRPEVRAFYNLEKMWLVDGGDAEAPTKPKKR